jgi:hypothetical protein
VRARINNQFKLFWGVLLPSIMFSSTILCPMLTSSTAALPAPPQQPLHRDDDDDDDDDDGGGGERLRRCDRRHEEVDGGPSRA